MNFKGMPGILTFALLTSVSVQANSNIQMVNSSLDNSSMKASFKMSGANLGAQNNKAKLLNFQIGSQFDHKLNKNLKMNIDAVMSFAKGTSDTLHDNNQLEATSGLSLKEAKVAWTPFTNIKLQAGAINQRVINNKILVDQIAFLGARQSLKVNTLGLNFELSANQSSPSNKNLSNRLDKVEEGSPAFFVETLSIAKSVRGVGSFRSTTSHFAYDNLSNSIATASGDLGNTVSSLGGDNSSFDNSYIGWAQTVEGELVLNKKYSIIAKTQFVINTAASKGSNSARTFAFKATKHKGDSSYSVAIENFRTESDSSVAFYNAGKYGHNNKKGNLIAFSFEDKKEQLNYNVGLGFNKEIIENEYQESENLIFFSLGKSYDLF